MRHYTSMQTTTLTAVLVWSRWLRLSHWLLAITAIGLIATGLLLRLDIPLSGGAQDLHEILGGLMLPALLLRLYLLFFGKGTDHLYDCEPNIHRLGQAWQMLRFYLTLGKSPLPKWYSHNPLWGPLYLILFFFLVLVSLSGLALLRGYDYVGGVSLLDLHRLCYWVVTAFTLLHLPAVFAHDLSGRAGDVSAMINGYRLFDAGARQASGKPGEQAIPLETLLNSLKR